MAMNMKINIESKGKKFAPKKPKKAVNPLFAEEEDEEETKPETVNESLLAEQMRQKTKGKIQQRLQQALQEDPSAFDYDDVLPQLQNNRKRLQEAAKKRNTTKKSKYIDTLLAKAEQRKFEHERVRETQILKQIEAEKEIYGEKPQYTTSKYKDHLSERQKWEEEQERLSALDEDVTKKQDMSGFHYANYFNAIGDRLVDSDPLAIKHNEELDSEAKKEAKETSAPSSTKGKVQDKDTSQENTTAAKSNDSASNNDEEELVPVLTREEKIEQALGLDILQDRSAEHCFEP